MQKLGQHFLKNKNVTAKIIDALALRPGDAVFEIGPGHGELTEELKKSADKLAARGKGEKIKIVSIEKDKNLYESLKKQFESDNEVEIICGDALKLLPSLVAKRKNSEASEYLLVGNIPYYITGHLLRTISELDDKPERTVLMVQKEVAERIVAQPPETNRLAASVQFWAEPKIIAAVPKSDFRPAPKVDSAVLFLERKNGLVPYDADCYYAAVRALFGQPRKTVLNNILNGTDTKKLPASDVNAATVPNAEKKKRIVARLESIGINPACRPQNLSIENIKAVAEMFFKNREGCF